MLFRPSPGPSRVVAAIEAGVEAEVVIARNGRPVAPDSIDGANPLIADLFERG
jgi:hypothetical protein